MTSHLLAKLTVSAVAVVGVSGLVGLSVNSKPVVIAEYATPLQGRTPAQRHNALLAGQQLDGKVVPPGGVLDFNQLVQSWSKDRGYLRAPVSFNGQLVSAYGGGVCQTSTTLYNAALLVGMKVLERHHHHFAATYAPPGRDAAVAFSNINLRLQNTLTTPLTVHVQDQGDMLVVQLTSSRSLARPITVTQDVHERSEPSVFEVAGSQGRIRNSGKPGFDVSVYRLSGGTKELISHDSYPVMNRIVERG